jgi:hypothetical protein
VLQAATRIAKRSSEMLVVRGQSESTPTAWHAPAKL